jgi:hypothetical protein
MKTFIGFDGFVDLPKKVPGVPLPRIAHESDLLLARLAASGIPVPPEGEGDMDLGLRRADQVRVDAWFEALGPDGGRPWIGVGPGSKMPSKIWPEERYRLVVSSLIAEYDVWPVVVGGDEDRERGDRLVRAWGRGYNSAGALSIRESASALSRCRLPGQRQRIDAPRSGCRDALRGNLRLPRSDRQLVSVRPNAPGPENGHRLRRLSARGVHRAKDGVHSRHLGVRGARQLPRAPGRWRGRHAPRFVSLPKANRVGFRNRGAYL